MLPQINETPSNVPRTTSKFSGWLGNLMLKLSGWRIVGEMPNEKKFIMAVAPHTSNWDFLVGIQVKFALNLRLHFLAKDSLFFWPFGIWLKYIGGMPINRRAAHGVVGQMVDKFEQKEQLIIVVAPEGTRSKVERWKTGFLQIAKRASVPVVPVQMDYRTKQIIFFPARHVEGDIPVEIDNFIAVYEQSSAKNPQNF